MKLTKGKLSKIRNTKVQSRKKRSSRKNKSRSTGKTLRNKKKHRGKNMHRRTLKGGVVTDEASEPNSSDPVSNVPSETDAKPDDVVVVLSLIHI